MGDTANATQEAIDLGRKNVHTFFSRYDPLRFRIWCEIGLTTVQLRVLFMIREEPGVTAGELANRLGVTPPTVSGIVDRLVRMDLVRREEDPADRRLVRNQLTEAGQRVGGQMSEGSEHYTRRILSEMSADELDAFNRGIAGFQRAGEALAASEPNLLAELMPSGKKAAPATTTEA